MRKRAVPGLDLESPPFNQLTRIQWLSPARSGHPTPEHARYQLYVGRKKRTSLNVFIKVTSKPGRVYEHDLGNEISTLTTINSALPNSPYFPRILQHGPLPDGRHFLVTPLFDELPLATSIGADHIPGRLVTNLRLAIEIANALTAIHGLNIFHVDLNPMNVLYRVRGDRPVVRIVDFESSYERARHAAGDFYSPPTTPGYSAPEVTRQAPDARSDLFSLGSVLYTTLAGYRWIDEGPVDAHVKADDDIDAELKDALIAAVDPLPANRYPSVLEFQAALANYLERIWPGRAW